MRKISNILFTFLLVFSLTDQSLYGQNTVLSDESALISFFSSAPLEDISASNNNVRAILNPDTGELAVLVVIEGFDFKKRLMQKHFNEQYMESDIYPEATFEGRIEDFDINEPGTEEKSYPVKGVLSIHGRENEFAGSAKLFIDDGIIHGESEFMVLLNDYNIKIPRLLIKNIAESVRVNVSMKLSEKNE